MPNAIEIANLAIGNIRARSIQTFNEDSLEAQQVKLRYDIARRYVLRDARWNFASKDIELALLDVEPRRFVYAYGYPNDCLFARFIIPNYILSVDRTIYYRYGFDYPQDLQRLKGFDEHQVPFEVSTIDGKKVVNCDLAQAYLHYTYDIEDSTLFDDTFVDMLSWWLTAQIAVPIVGAEKGREMRRDALQMYNTLKGEAREKSANERMNNDIPESDVINARMY